MNFLPWPHQNEMHLARYGGYRRYSKYVPRSSYGYGIRRNNYGYQRRARGRITPRVFRAPKRAYYRSYRGNTIRKGCKGLTQRLDPLKYTTHISADGVFKQALPKKGYVMIVFTGADGKARYRVLKDGAKMKMSNPGDYSGYNYNGDKVDVDNYVVFPGAKQEDPAFQTPLTVN